MELQDALDELTSTYKDLDLVARGLQVDGQEVADALEDAEPDSAEAVALKILAKYNPTE
jgi:NACalpha-BTF3-like transcription factor